MTREYLDKIRAKHIGPDVKALIAEVDRLHKREADLLQVNNEELERRRKAERWELCFQRAFGIMADWERIEVFLARQWEWSRRTFGPGYQTKQLLDHIRKEIVEIEKDPTDRIEWIDIALIALDGYQRDGGGTINTLMPDLLAKQAKNFQRQWIARDPDSAIEHDRTKGESA